MNSTSKSKNGRKRKKSKTQNTSEEKPGKLNCTQGKNVNNNNNMACINEQNYTMNTVNPIAQNFGSPVLNTGYYQHQQYQTNPSFNQTPPTMSQLAPGLFSVPVTPQVQTPQPIYNSTMNQPADTMKIDNLTQKVDQMFKKLSLLDSLSDKITNFQSTMNTLVSNVEEVTKRVTEVEKSLDFINEKYEMGRQENGEIKTDMAEIKAKNFEINDNMERLTSELYDLRERHIDLQTRSMRENLIFSGIPETTENETSEETGEKVKTFMKNDLKLGEPVDFVRAHRFGKKDKGPRPIVCRFKTFNDRETVRKSANNLKGTKYGLSEQFPKEINDRRRELWPYYKEAKGQERKAYFRRDRLFIDGREFRKSRAEIEMDRARFERQGARPKQFTRRDPPPTSDDEMYY